MIELSLFDQIFYKFEQGGLSPVYMAGANIFEPIGSRHGLNGRTLSAHLASRLEKIPLLRKKLVQDPMRIGNMRLVDEGTGYLRISGTATNASAYDVKNMTVSGVLIDGNGQIVSVGSAYVLQEDIAPGEAVSLSVRVAKEAYASYQVYAQAERDWE